MDRKFKRVLITGIAGAGGTTGAGIGLNDESFCCTTIAAAEGMVMSITNVLAPRIRVPRANTWPIKSRTPIWLRSVSI